MTPDRLNDHVKRASGVTAGHLIRQRVLTEAKRQLVFTGQPIHEISYDLAFRRPVALRAVLSQADRHDAAGIPRGQGRLATWAAAHGALHRAASARLAGSASLLRRANAPRFAFPPEPHHPRRARHGLSHTTPCSRCSGATWDRCPAPIIPMSVSQAVRASCTASAPAASPCTTTEKGAACQMTRVVPAFQLDRLSRAPPPCLALTWDRDCRHRRRPGGRSST